MTSGAYSFIDIAVISGVRGHFAAGDPLVLLSDDLKTLLWVNGPGAALLGFDSIEAAMGTPFEPGINVRRQIAATHGFPHIERERSVVIRLQSGLESRALQCMASSIKLPGGGLGILLTVPGTTPAGLDRARAAARAIGGINANGHYAALIGAGGKVVAASDGFSSLGIASATLQTMVRRVAGESDRLVKRMIPADVGEIAAGIGRLVDDPPMHLLIAVADETLDQTSASKGTSSETTTPVSEPIGRSEAVVDEPPSDAVSARDTQAVTEASDETTTRPEPSPVIPQADETDSENLSGEQEAGRIEAENANPPSPENAGVETITGSGDKGQALPASSEAVRFVWRTDAQGRFSSISEEFSTAVGIDATDIIGRPFTDVAAQFGFDVDGEIAGLLARRDTWSGRAILWPLSGTNKRVPVDLAALPAYSRDRKFEGFRGFGVVRLNEAVVDLQPVAPPPPSVEDDGDDGGPTSPQGMRDETEDEQEADDSRAASTALHDPFLGEKPAIEMTPTPERRDSDKVIRLATHRDRQAPGKLSQVEETAFREIGERLKSDEAVPADDRLPEIEPDLPDAAETEGSDKKAGLIGQPDVDAAEGESAADDVSEPHFATSGFLPSAFAGEINWPQGGSDISILEQLPVAVLIRSGDTLHYANPEFFKLTDYRSIDELASAGGFDVLFAGPDGLADENDETARPAMRLLTRDGTEKLCEAYLRSVRWEDHRALMLAIRPSPFLSPPMAGPDARVDDLNARVEELTAILDTATDGVVLVSETGDIRSVNRSAEALFGFDANELVDKPFTALFAIESQKAAGDYLAGLSGPGVASILNDGREVIGREAQGRFIPLFMTMGKLPGQRGFCAVMRDITQWKRAEEELTQARGQAEKASSLKSEFLARISHEVRTPLNAIIGFSELMMDEKFGPIGNERYRDYLRDINRSGNHVLDLVNDLLDISKIEAGEQDMDFESVSLNDALADTVALMQPEANRERVIIRSSFSSNLPEVVADLRSVKQIALNLLSNAIRFTPAGGQVIVSTAYDTSGDVIVRFRDTGIGMSRTEVEQALRPFKQISSVKNRRQDGTGLGLPLTKAMVEANRAAFSIDSKPEEGTIVEITFPSTRVLAD